MKVTREQFYKAVEDHRYFTIKVSDSEFYCYEDYDKMIADFPDLEEQV